MTDRRMQVGEVVTVEGEVWGYLKKTPNDPAAEYVYVGKDNYDGKTSYVLPRHKFNVSSPSSLLKQWEMHGYTIDTTTIRRTTNPLGSHPLNAYAYAEMCRAAILYRWPERYSTDLTDHDASRLGIHPDYRIWWELEDGEPFGWILRESGTEFIPCDADPETCGACYWNSPSYHYFWWDGRTLMEVPSAAAILDRLRS